MLSSLAKLARRGLELVLAQTPERKEVTAPWRPPTVRRLGWKGLTHGQIKDAAQTTAAKEDL